MRPASERKRTRWISLDEWLMIATLGVVVAVWAFVILASTGAVL